jgi:hypothetical protein
MSLGTVLNVAVGLVLTFLILSLLSTSVQEAGASIIRTRGRLLKSGLRSLLGDGAADGAGTALFEKVFGHGLVQGLSRSGLPSYLPANSFSLALFDALSDKSAAPLFSQIERGVLGLPEGITKQSLAVFIVASGGDMDVLRARVENWFNDAMDRLSGMYKRRSQLAHFLFGLALALAFNVDTLNIAHVLWSDAGKGQAIAAAAQSFVAANPAAAGAPSMTAPEALKQLEALPIPMGWTTATLPSTALAWVYSLAGWLVTGFAISLGAPFWFDLLQKLMNISVRGAGPKPQGEQ